MRPYGTDLRRRVIGAYQRGEGSVRELAELFELAPRTVQSWLNLARDHGCADPRPHGGGFPARITAEHREVLAQLVRDTPDATLAQQAERFALVTGCRVHPSTVSRALARMNMTRKKKTLHATERDRPEVQQARLAFCEWVARVPRHRLLFVDEFGFNLAMTPAYAWAWRGARAYSSVPFNPGHNVTLTVGLRVTGPLAPFVIVGGTDGDVFTTYAATQLGPQGRRGDIVLVDDLGAHRATAAREALRSLGIRLKILPPYSPDFSPVEACGSKIKTLVRQAEPRTEQELLEAIAHAVAKVTPQDARAWFEHYGYVPCCR